MSVGEQIKKARKRAGLKQSELAEKLGLAVITIGQYERGQRQPRYDMLQRIAEALGVSAQELVDWGAVDKEEFKRLFIYGEGIEQPPKERIATALDKLNVEGQEKAAERVEELTEIPRYQARKRPQDAPQSTPSIPKGKNTVSTGRSADGLQGRTTAITMTCPICGTTLRGDSVTGKAFCPSCQQSFPLFPSKINSSRP